MLLKLLRFVIEYVNVMLLVVVEFFRNVDGSVYMIGIVVVVLVLISENSSIVLSVLCDDEVVIVSVMVDIMNGMMIC